MNADATLAELTAILGDDPVRKAKALIELNRHNDKKWRDYEQEYILPCFTWAAECGIDLNRLVRETPGKNCTRLLVESLRAALAEKDAAYEQAKAENARLQARVTELEKPKSCQHLDRVTTSDGDFCDACGAKL